MSAPKAFTSGLELVACAGDENITGIESENGHVLVNTEESVYMLMEDKTMIRLVEKDGAEQW